MIKMLVGKKTFLIFNIVLFLIEGILIYFMISSFLTKDLISPSSDISVKYFQVKASNIIK